MDNIIMSDCILEEWQQSSVTNFTHVCLTGIKTYVIGVGNNLNKSEIEVIASEPHSKYLMSVADFSAMNSIVDDIVATACADPGKFEFEQYVWAVSLLTDLKLSG